MTCATCGKDAPNMQHNFHEGSWERPVRIWSISAPLYFKADPTNRHAVAGYCSADCATKSEIYP